MALSRDKKQQIITELSDLLAASKMTVVAKYEGTTVKEMQALRKRAEETGSTVKVVKNRLVIKAASQNDALKDIDLSELKQMLLYVFNAEDEVAAAQTIKSFVTDTNAPVEFVGALSPEGVFVSAEQVTALADLPSKDQLIAGIVNLLQSPTNNLMSSLGGNLHGYLDAISASKA